MSGKRLLDAAKFLSAGGSVAKQHVHIRQEQWSLFTNTSSLAKAVKGQTDRVTVTVGAAVELAKRFNEETPPPAGQQTAHTYPPPPPRADSLEYGQRTGSSVGFKDTTDDGSLASLRKKEQQRRVQDHVPVQALDESAAPGATSGQDVFHQRSEGTTLKDSSSLPRTTLPEHADDTPAPAHELPPEELNHDVYPAPSNSEEPQVVDIFHSPTVSKMLGQTGSKIGNPYGKRKRMPPKPLPEMMEASKKWEQERIRQQEVDKLSTQSQAQPLQPQDSTVLGGDKETESLAADLAQDAHAQTAAVSTEDQRVQSYQMHESRVPSSRFGRIWQYAGLGTSMAFGAMGEGFRRLAGGAGEGSLMLSEGNINRLVAKLSRMRGAALKLGQMMSFQDSKVLPPTINAILQRVQDNADYMPSSQRDKVLSRNLGSEWRDLFSAFEDKPFAAASIGQVHKATLKSNGKDVAVKIQYPGVRNSIDSDLNNLSLLLTASQLLPKGLFLDKTIANARTELGWECDYEREAAACKRFRNELLLDEQDVFAVPKIYDEACGMDVLTAEFMHGKAVTKVKDITQQERDWIGTNVLRLCLRELMEFRFMQTDPNWTNFLYNRETRKLELLDFGASREFPDKFVEPYVELLIAASKHDRDACRDLSVQLGYLTGHESPAMLKAHVDSVLTLAEPFVESAPEIYNFEGQTVTDRVRNNIGLMLRERLAPPPEETYSLHRKLSGAFLLCARLQSKVPAREMFAEAARVWRARATK